MKILVLTAASVLASLFLAQTASAQVQTGEFNEELINQMNIQETQVQKQRFYVSSARVTLKEQVTAANGITTMTYSVFTCVNDREGKGITNKNTFLGVSESRFTEEKYVRVGQDDGCFTWDASIETTYDFKTSALKRKADAQSLKYVQVVIFSLNFGETSQDLPIYVNPAAPRQLFGRDLLSESQETIDKMFNAATE